MGCYAGLSATVGVLTISVLRTHAVCENTNGGEQQMVCYRFLRHCWRFYQRCITQIILANVAGENTNNGENSPFPYFHP